MYIEWKKIEFPKELLYMNLGTTRLRGRPRNRRQDEVREDGRIVGGEGRQEKVHNREEGKKLLRTARNHHILHMLIEWNCVTKDIYITKFKKNALISGSILKVNTVLRW
jgi:hypothetical protein